MVKLDVVLDQTIVFSIFTVSVHFREYVGLDTGSLLTT